MTSQVQRRSAEVCRKLNLRSHLVFQKTLEYQGVFTKGVLIPVPVPPIRRSTALYSQVGCGHEPLAEKAFTIGLTRGRVACEGVERMAVIFELVAVGIHLDTQLPGEGGRTGGSN